MKDQKIYAVLDNIRSLENIGSIFRTADAFKISKIYLGGICGTPPHNKIAKAALGADKWIKWEHNWHTWRIIEKLKKDGVNIVSLEQNKKSISINKFKPKYPMALVVGNEIQGISESVLKRSDYVVHIPMYGKKESLNVSVAFGIAINSILNN